MQITKLTAAMLGVMFVDLKLCGQIDWGWFYVTLPFWFLCIGQIALALVAGVVALLTTLSFVAVWVSCFIDNFRRDRRTNKQEKQFQADVDAITKEKKLKEVMQ